jgi:multidrug efflux pump subunit AcrB
MISDNGHEPAHNRGESSHGSENSGMGSRLASFSIRRPVTICMIFVSLLTLGIISVEKIPLVLLPAVDNPALFISVPYANATPSQVQEAITKPLEEVLSTIAGVQQMSSNSRSDSAGIQLRFGFDRDVDVLRAEVREKIDQVRNDLPDDVENIWIQNFSTEDIPVLFAVISSTRDLRSSYDFLDL